MAIPSIYQRLFNADVRIESAWPFPVGPAPKELIEALEDCESLPGSLVSLVEHWSDEEEAQLFGGDHDAEQAFDELCCEAFNHELTGWLALASVPVFTPRKGGGCSFSWGHYRTELIFAETADALLEAAVRWGEERYQEDTAKAKANA